MVYRDEQGRVAYYEERRWTERPEAYLRRALSRALFEERGFKRTVTGVGASLDVELTAFEELRGPKPVARLEATVLLEDGRTSLFEHTFVVERPIASSDENDRDSASVLAHSEALHQVVAQIADRIATSMATLPPDPEPAPLEPRPTSPAKP
jgi:cholesterol transport system auxiliary component